MAYNELIKNFEKVRVYMREFYAYGFKSRTEYDAKSARSYDDERRRLESWLGDYMRFMQTPEGKNVFLSVDSRVTRKNPFYKAWKAKSFTDGDITLHFAIFDILYELGERMRPNYLTEYFPKYIAKHRMPKMRFHDLRHSCASLLLANGVPLKQIQEWLGHSDFSTTANIYAHLDYRSKISSTQAMEQGMLLPRSDDFGSRWEDVTEQGKIAEPDLNPIFD